MPVDGQDRPVEPASPERSPERWAYGSLLGEILKEAMLVLSPEQRKTLLLKEVEGLKYQEIAGQEGCSVGTIKSRVFRARQILMPLLQEWL